MTEPLSPEREQEIRESIPTVYGPPWTLHPNWEDGTWRVMYATDHPLAGLVATVPDYGEHLAEFIATARAAVPELLAEIDRLRAELASEGQPMSASAIADLRRLERVSVLRAAADKIERLYGCGWPLRRMADDAERAKITGRLVPDPLPVSRYDTAIEPAPEEEPILLVGAIAEDGRPVALFFDPETRRKVAGWLAPAGSGQTSAPRTERSYWVAIADALNAAGAAGLPVGIDLDGTLTDHRVWSVVWDRQAERWQVAGYDFEDGPEPGRAPDFFQAEHTYSRGRWQFQCLCVELAPWDGQARAVGFLSRKDGTGNVVAFRSEDWEHGEWRDVSAVAYPDETARATSHATNPEGPSQ
ncbi:hypothetical protein [Streptomyces sp. NPDC002328]|uniref:hypothetical protein n=1 Tax=Streptomyces sp. NPDC002328 TaxID=3364642 RepID=UPI003691AD1D